MRTYYGLKDNEPEIMRNKYGSNRLSEIKSETFREKYFKSFDDPLVTILLIALGVNVIFTFFGKVDWFECAGILISVLISTFISTLSEYKNEKNFKTLSDKATKTSVKVYRSGKLTEIDISEIVCEDYCLLQAGDMIPADGIITDGNISVDQSCLNGENKEVYNVANPNSIVTVREYAQTLANIGKVSLKFELPNAIESKGYSKQADSILDSQKLINTGWEPMYDLQKGLQHTFDIRRNLNESKRNS